MTQTEFPFRVHCACCGTMIASSSVMIFDTGYVFCALCEVEALFTDGDQAWIWDGLVCDSIPAEEF